MNPILEPQSDGPAGHTIGSFEMKVARVCREHLETGRAKAFAFIFANFSEGITLDIITDHACNRELHRLSGSDLTIFFLWSPKHKDYADEFNDVMMGKLGLPQDQHLPCIVFFRLDGDRAICIEPVPLVEDWLRGYQTLHKAVERFLAGEQQAAYLDEVEFKDIPVKDLTQMLLKSFSTPR